MDKQADPEGVKKLDPEAVEKQKARKLRLQEQGLKLSANSVIQKLQVSPNFAKLRTPCRVLIAGPTLTGKSFLGRN